MKYLSRGESIIQRHRMREKLLDSSNKSTSYVDLKSDGNVFGWQLTVSHHSLSVTTHVQTLPTHDHDSLIVTYCESLLADTHFPLSIISHTVSHFSLPGITHCQPLLSVSHCSLLIPSHYQSLLAASHYSLSGTIHCPLLTVINLSLFSILMCLFKTVNVSTICDNVVFSCNRSVFSLSLSLSLIFLNVRIRCNKI